MAKPDDRSDNVEHLQEAVQNTVENLNEAEDYLSEHADEIGSAEQSRIEKKNENRRESIRGFRSEIKDEADYNNRS
ncbi:spore protein [Paenibacillus darwinianus]|uniref:Spore protein n=1 Tax=Paenibacillus darwinianus TaxID=1380763 RepID=A0A9W5S1P4_9BACL|nr:small acid-soluble spore protein Tlp [Paenibacillus darwinianus]EXX89813.1 spore protein [Paenibacillus darwinianus]EXX90247.1 spore protein [Paenibacillus darwinianus]EXX90673.1 spore protein [Paenibacillus darwinianus]